MLNYSIRLPPDYPIGFLVSQRNVAVVVLEVKSKPCYYRSLDLHVVSLLNAVVLHLYVVYFLDSEDSNKPKEEKSSKSLALGLSFLAVAVIAIFATIIVVKWEKHERKVRPDYLESLRSSARGKK